MMPQDNDTTKNMILAMALTMAILLGWSYFRDPTPPASEKAAVSQTQAKHSASQAPSVPSISLKAPQSRAEVVASEERIPIETPFLKGSIRLQGARVDDLSLTKYKQDPKGQGTAVVLLSPDQTANSYFADFGWASAGGTMAVPNPNTVWKIKEGKVLTPGSPVILTWNNGEGLLFERTVQIDSQYLFTVTDKVINKKTQEILLAPYGLIIRDNKPAQSGGFLSNSGPLAFEGAIGYLGDKLIEVKYEDLQQNKKEVVSVGGWAGSSDKYWLTALIPPQNEEVKITYRQEPGISDPRYVTEYLGPTLSLKGGETIEHKTHLFAGAKILEMLDGYEEKLGIKHFDLAVDFGWFYFLTKPIFKILTFGKQYLGNFGLSILLLTVLLKLLFFPLANKSYRSMARMKQLQPKMNKLRELYKDDKVRMNQELMALYKKENVNPMAGCLPLLIQIPFFIALYKVLLISIEMRHAPFYGWIYDLSAPDPTTIFNLFGLIPWNPPSFLQIGAWPLLMGATMVFQQRLNPSSGDPMQEKMMMVLPIVFTVMFASFPAGLVIYWAWQNLLTIAQQWTIMRLEEKRKLKKT